MTLQLRAVIFDLDGTLADSIGDIGGAMNEALAARGLPTHSLDAYKRMVGDGVEMLAQRAGQGAKVDLNELVAEYRQRYAHRIESDTRPYPGIPQMLDALVARGLTLAVLSNKRDDFTVELVRRQFSRWPFAQVRGEREGVPRKPDPTAALDIAKALNVAPADCAFVGDTPIDMNTAYAAGMVGIGVLWGFRPKDELQQAHARHLVAHPDELVALLSP